MHCWIRVSQTDVRLEQTRVHYQTLHYCVSQPVPVVLCALSQSADWRITIPSSSYFRLLFCLCAAEMSTPESSLAHYQETMRTLHYITCNLLDAFIQSDLHTFSTVDNPHRSNLGWSVLSRDTTTCWLQWDSNLLSPDSKFSTLSTEPQKYLRNNELDGK